VFGRPALNGFYRLGEAKVLAPTACFPGPPLIFLRFTSFFKPPYNHLPLQWAQKGVRKEDHVLPWLRRMRKQGSYGVYFIFKSMEQGPTFRISLPRYPTKDPNHRILAPRAQPLHPLLLLHLR
jgi:hypothetical protein